MRDRRRFEIALLDALEEATRTLVRRRFDKSVWHEDSEFFAVNEPDGDRGLDFLVAHRLPGDDWWVALRQSRTPLAPATATAFGNALFEGFMREHQDGGLVPTRYTARRDYVPIDQHPFFVALDQEGGGAEHLVATVSGWLAKRKPSLEEGTQPTTLSKLHAKFVSYGPGGSSQPYIGRYIGR